MFNTFQKQYFKLIFEQTLDSTNQNILPSPFNELLLGLKNAMSKALNAAKDQLTKINSEVNSWRDKLILAWKNLSSTLTKQQQDFLNNVLLDLTNKYITWMHGCNTGY